MIKHFEDLWGAAEKSFQNDLNIENEVILNKASINLNLFKTLSKYPATEDLDKIKAHLMGELLLSLSHLSLKENIDVFYAMQLALKKKLET